MIIFAAVCGFIGGAIFGVFLMALMVAAGDADDRENDK